MEEQELKQRFFAQYLGCEMVLSLHQNVFKFKFKPVDIGEGMPAILEKSHLILKDLSKIKDEDAGKAGFWRSKSLINDIETDGYDCLTIEQVDILRSLGYLVPFMHLSIQDLLNRGWAKYE